MFRSPLQLILVVAAPISLLCTAIDARAQTEVPNVAPPAAPTDAAPTEASLAPVQSVSQARASAAERARVEARLVNGAVQGGTVGVQLAPGSTTSGTPAIPGTPGSAAGRARAQAGGVLVTPGLGAESPATVVGEGMAGAAPAEPDAAEIPSGVAIGNDGLPVGPGNTVAPPGGPGGPGAPGTAMPVAPLAAEPLPLEVTPVELSATAAFDGRRVTVRSRVTDVENANVFTVRDARASSDSDVVVVVPAPLSDTPLNEDVIVTGTVRPFSVDEMRRHYPWLASSPRIQQQLADKRVLVAESVLQIER